MQIVRVALTARDPMAAGEWYRKVLGLPVANLGDEARIRIGSTELYLRPGPGPEDGAHHLEPT